MGNRTVPARRADENLTHRQPLAKLEQARLAQKFAGLRFRQEINVEAGGDGKAHRPDLRQNGDVKRHIGQRKHGRARNCAAGAQVARMGVHAHHGAHRADRNQLEQPRTAFAELRELPVKKGTDLGRGHQRLRRGGGGHVRNFLLDPNTNSRGRRLKPDDGRRAIWQKGRMPQSARPPLLADPAAPPLRRASAQGIALLTLSRPLTRNALSEAMLAALAEALAAIAADTTIRAVVLAGEGPVFCAGHDLKELTARRADPDQGRAYFADIMQRCSALMQAIVALPQPVIAAVEGLATAAGCQLVASCDLAVAGAGAQFCTPGVNLGLFCSTPMVALSRNLPRKQAMEMLLTGDLYPALDAQRFGLVNRIVPAGGAVEAALALARQIAGKSAVSVKIGKRAFYAQAEMGLAQAYDYAASVMVDNMLARDAQEGIGAFIGKRTPEWEREQAGLSHHGAVPRRPPGVRDNTRTPVIADSAEPASTPTLTAF